MGEMRCDAGGGARRAGAVFLAAVLISLLAPSAYGEDLFDAMGVIRPKVRLEAPGFTLASLAGGEASLSDFKGKVVLLSFWATWCKPCRKEMPAMERLWQELGGEGLVIVAVASDRGSFKKVERRVGKFIRELGVTFPVLLDPAGEVRRSYEVMGLPTSYIIGRDGKFRGKVMGEREWDGEAALEFFIDLLGEKMVD